MEEARLRLRRLWDSPLAWTLAALALRVGFALALGQRQYQIDENAHAAFGLSVALHGVVGADGKAMVIPPLPAAFFAPWFALLGPSWIWPRLAQACLASFLPWVLSALTFELLESRKAANAVLRLAAVYPFFIYYSGMLMTETLYTCLSVPALLLLCVSLKERGRRPAVAAAAGLLGALAGLTRTEGAVIFVILLGFAALVAAAGRYSWRAWAAAALLLAAPILGWAARNRAYSGGWALDNHGGITFYNGTVLFSEGEIDTAVAMEKFYASDFWRGVKGLDETRFDRACFRAAVDFMREHPRLTLWQWWRKTINFWRPYPRVDKVYSESVHSRPGLGLGRWALVVISLCFEPALLLGGVWGLWLSRARLPYLFPIPLFVAGSFAAHMLTVSMMRYRVPVMAYFMIFAAAALAARSERA